MIVSHGLRHAMVVSTLSSSAGVCSHVPLAPTLKSCSPQLSLVCCICGQGPASVCAPRGSVPATSMADWRRRSDKLYFILQTLDLQSKGLLLLLPGESSSAMVGPCGQSPSVIFSHKAGDTVLVSLSLVTEPSDLFQFLHLCHRDKAICLSLQSTWCWRGGRHSESQPSPCSSCVITALQRSLAGRAGPFCHPSSLWRLLGQGGRSSDMPELCCSACGRAGKMKYAWGVRGGGKRQRGN